MLKVLSSIATWINTVCAQYEYWQIVIGTVVLVIVVQSLYDYFLCGIGEFDVRCQKVSSFQIGMKCK